MQHEVFEHDLDGAEGLVVHVPGARVGRLAINFNSGFQFGDPKLYELPHVLEHLVGASTKNFPRHNDLKADLMKNGALRNASTSSVNNSYWIEFAAFELDRILELQREYFLNLRLPDEVVAAETSNVRQELSRNNSEPSSVTGVSFAAAAFPARIQVWSERLTQLPDLTVARLEEYYRKSHTWENLRFYLVGDFADGGHGAVEQIGKALGDLPRGSRFEPDYSPGRGFTPIALEREQDQIYYETGWFSDKLPQDKWPAAMILRSLLGEGYASRVYGAARFKGLAYHVDCNVGFEPGSASLEFGGYVTRDNLQPLFELIAEQMSQVRDGNVTEEEVQAAKNLRSGGQLRAYQTPGQLLGWYMHHYEERGEVEDFDGWVKKLLAVSREEVVEVARHVCATAARGAVFLGQVSPGDAKKYAAILDPVSIH